MTNRRFHTDLFFGSAVRAFCLVRLCRFLPPVCRSCAPAAVLVSAWLPAVELALPMARLKCNRCIVCPAHLLFVVQAFFLWPGLSVFLFHSLGTEVGDILSTCSSVSSRCFFPPFPGLWVL